MNPFCGFYCVLFFFWLVGSGWLVGRTFVWVFTLDLNKQQYFCKTRKIFWEKKGKNILVLF